jgi:hypothetical protein
VYLSCNPSLTGEPPRADARWMPRWGMPRLTGVRDGWLAGGDAGMRLYAAVGLRGASRLANRAMS